MCSILGETEGGQPQPGFGQPQPGFGQPQPGFGNENKWPQQPPNYPQNYPGPGPNNFPSPPMPPPSGQPRPGVHPEDWNSARDPGNPDQVGIIILKFSDANL